LRIYKRNEKMDDFYVYIYLDPRKPGKYKYGSCEFEYEPFYVGKGKNGRWKNINGRTNYFINRTNKIKKYGLKPIIFKLIENLNEKQSFYFETQLICKIGRKDLDRGPLINFTDGGDGSSGKITSEKTKRILSEKKKGRHPSRETRNKMSKIRKGKYSGESHPFYGKHHSEEWKKKQSEKLKGEDNPNYGKHPSEKTRKKQSEKLKGENHPMFGRHHSEETKRKQSEKLKGENHPMFGKHPSEETRKLMSEKHRGENSPNSILTKKDIIKIRIDLREGILTQREIAEKFGVGQPTISHIKNNKIWKHIQI